MPETETQTENGAQTLPDFIKEKTEQGLSQDEIMVLANMRFGGQDSPTAATPGSGEQLGPDPDMVRRYNQMMKTYKPPQTRFKFAALDGKDPELHALVMGALVEAAKNLERGRKEAIADAVVAKLDGYGGVELKRQFLTWVHQWGWWESARRRLAEQMSDSAVLSIIISEHWHSHAAERAMLQSVRVGGGTSGPAGTFNPGEGNWGT